MRHVPDACGPGDRAERVWPPCIEEHYERHRDEAPPQTVYVGKHAWARDHGPLRQVRTPVMWAQVLHGTNLSNIVNGASVHPRVVWERFEFDLGYDATPARGDLVRGQVGHLGQLVGLRVAHPGELTKWAEAAAWTRRGTHQRPQEPDAPTVTDTVQTWERDTRKRLRRARRSLAWHPDRSAQMGVAARTSCTQALLS